MSRDRVFHRPANRLCVWIPGHGFVPVAEGKDDKPELLSEPPRRIGDDALIEVEGQLRLVRLLATGGGSTYLVDMGAA